MEKQEVMKIIANSAIVELKPTVENLKEILKWTSSRYNEYKKRDVIRSIQEGIEEEIIFQCYTAATYTETNGYGVKYYLLKENNQAYLVENGSFYNKVYNLV